MLPKFSGLAVATAIGLAACGGSASSTPTPTPTPSPSATPFVAVDAGFSAVFPATPQRQAQDINQAGLKLTVTLYTATTNDEQVVVGYQPLPLAPQGDAIQPGLDGAVAGSAQNVNGQVLSKANVQFVGQAAEDAVIQAQGAVVHERVVFIGAKLYIFEGITRTVDAKHPAYDKLLATFKTI